jgi:dihydropteroate synthase
MGVLNVTPDSFSDGGRFFRRDLAIHHALQLVADGADILDIGAESTRPGSEPVAADEELARLLPVLEALHGETDCPVSVDTCKAAVADRALRAGAAIVNDVTGFQGDPDMAKVAAEHGVPAVLMHIRGNPKTMQQDTSYGDLIGEIKDYLARSIEVALAAGVPENGLVIDPGIGFGKNFRQNLEILNRLHEFRSLERPILVGPSRKSFIGHVTGLPVDQRAFGTAAAVALCAWNGAHIVRVHDVREMRQVLDVADAIRAPASAESRLK